jgi:hypothetical protein
MPCDTGLAAQVGRVVPRWTAGAPDSQPAPHRLVRGMARRWIATREPGTSMPALHPRKRCFSPIAAVDLLSREFDRPTSSRARSLHSCNPRDLSRASDSARLYRTKHEPSTKTRASHCWHHLPRVANRFGAELASCGPEASTSRDAWLPRHDSRGHCQPLHEPRQRDH